MSKQTVGWGCALVAVMGLWAINQLPVHGQFGGGGGEGGKSNRGGGEYGGEFGGESGGRVVVQAEPATAAEVIKAVLEKKLKTSLDCEAEPLNDVLDSIADEYDIPIIIDKAALEVLGVSIDSEVTIKLHNISLKSALNLMLKEPGLEELCYIIDEEVLLITTQEQADASLSTRVYRVDDLLDSKQQRFNRVGQSVDPGDLIDLVVLNVEHDSWTENGTGEGEIQSYPPGMLVITQTNRVHEAIEKLFSNLRRTKRQILASNQSAPSAVKPVTKGFAIKVELGKNPGKARIQLAEVIKHSVDWSATGEAFGEVDAMISVLPNRVMVRHLPKVQQQVSVVLKDMRVLQGSMGGGGRGCGYSGGGGGAGGSQQHKPQSIGGKKAAEPQSTGRF